MSRGNWFVIYSYAGLAAASQMLWLTFTPITSSAATYYGVSDAAIGGLSIVFPLLYVALAIPFGLSLDRWFRPALVIGAVLTAIGALVRLVDSFLWVALGQLLVAVAQPIVVTAITALCVRYLPPNRRPKGLAIGSAALFFGMLVAFLCAAVFPDSIKDLLLAQATLSVLAAVATCLGLMRPGAFGNDLEVSEFETVDSARRHPLKTVWRDPAIRWLAVIVFAGLGLFVTVTTWLEVLLRPSGVSTEAVGYMLLCMTGAGILGALVLPAVATKRRNHLAIMTTALVASAAGCVALAVVHTVWMGFVVSLILGFLLLATLPIILELVEERTGPAASTATSLIWLSGNAGGVVLSVLIGLLVDWPSLAFASIGVFALVVGLPFLAKLRTLPSVRAPGIR